MLPSQSMCSEHEVLAWFKGLDAADRIKFMCNLFSCCFPTELRYFITYLTGTKLAADKANINCSSTWTTLDDPITRSKLVFSVVFLEEDSSLSAKDIYDFVLQRCAADWTGIIADKTAIKQMDLLLTLAVNHPSFGFRQKTNFARLLQLLKKGERLKNEKPERKDEVICQTTTCNNVPFSPSPIECKDISLEDPFSPGLLKGCKGTSNEDSSLQPKDKKNGLPEEQPHSSSLSNEGVHDLSKNEMCSSNLPEINIVSQKGQTTSSLSKENVNNVVQQDSSVSSQLNDSAVPVKKLSFSPSVDSASVVPMKEQSYSSQLEGSVNAVLTKEQLSCSPIEENSSLSQEKVFSSSMEIRESSDLKKLIDLTVSSPAVINKAVVRHSGKIRNLELKGNGKKGVYRIEVTWACGRKTECVKTFKQLKLLHQKVVQLASDPSLQKATNKDISSFPDLNVPAPFGKNLVEQYDKLAAYLSNFLTMLPLSIRDNESVVRFFQSTSGQPPRPILVGQGNLNQTSFTEKPNPALRTYSYCRNKNNGKYFGFPERHFRNSSNSWSSTGSISPYNLQRNSYVGNHPKPFRQKKFKFYPPISESGTSSPQNSQSGSSQNSRSSSPCVERDCGIKNSMQNSIKNHKYPAESVLHKTKPDHARNPYPNNKENNGNLCGIKTVISNS